MISLLAVLLSTQLAAAPLLSDGDETTSVGTARTITPHPSWAQPLEGTQWISIAQTGWPLATWLPNGTVVSFSEAFSLASMPSSATVTYAADDSASLYVNGVLVLAEASTAGNGYTVCSDVAPTCTSHTQVNILPWLHLDSNEIRFDVAQRGGWSYGLNYAVGLAWMDEPPVVPTPEPGTWVVVIVFALMAVLGILDSRAERLRLKRLNARVDEVEHNIQSCDRYEEALRRIVDHGQEDYSKEIARKALEE